MGISLNYPMGINEPVSKHMVTLSNKTCYRGISQTINEFKQTISNNNKMLLGCIGHTSILGYCLIGMQWGYTLNALEHMLKSHERLGGAQGIIPDTWRFSSGDNGQWSCIELNLVIAFKMVPAFPRHARVHDFLARVFNLAYFAANIVYDLLHCFICLTSVLNGRNKRLVNNDPRNGKLRGISGYNWDFTSTVVHSLRRKFNTWLVAKQPLWKIWKSVGMMTFPIYGKS